MGYKPEDFFVGVVDFFAVLLPGALLSFVMMDFATRNVFGKVLPHVEGTQAWVVFAFSSYLLGHFVFLAGSYVDLIYDPLRKVFKPQDRTYLRARELKEKCLGDSVKEPLMNTFQWSKTTIQLKCPAALAEIRRYEADSKFFRSLIVVLVITIFVLISKGAWNAGLLCLLLMLASFGRYAEQRWKAAQRAYEYLIAIGRLGGSAERSS